MWKACLQIYFDYDTQKTETQHRLKYLLPSKIDHKGQREARAKDPKTLLGQEGGEKRKLSAKENADPQSAHEAMNYLRLHIQ